MLGRENTGSVLGSGAVDADFWALVCEDEEWLDAEFRRDRQRGGRGPDTVDPPVQPRCGSGRWSGAWTSTIRNDPAVAARAPAR
jgi:hypothetical protein